MSFLLTGREHRPGPGDQAGAPGDQTGQGADAWPGVIGTGGQASADAQGRRVGQAARSLPAARWAGLRPGLTLRARMALLAGVAVAAAVAVVVSVALGVTRIVLNQAIDDQLVEQARASAGNLQASEISVRALNFGMEVQFLDAQGVPLESAFPSLEKFAIPVDVQDTEVARGLRTKNLHTVTVDGARYRVATVPLRYPPPLTGTGALQFARPTADVDRTLRDLGLVLFIVGLVGVVGSVIAGRLVARGSLKPVDAAAAAAEEVARTQDLSALIPVTGSDEIARLATSLNSMLRALEASRLRQRQLVDDAAHELRTPLTSLRTNIELLLRAETSTNRALPTADREALLRDVDAQMRELTHLVTEVIELARDEAPTEEVERLDLAQVVRSAAERARRRAKGRNIRIEVTAEPCLVDGRPNLLERAVTNLLDNAVKFGPESSTVWVACRAGEVTVADEGPGIAPGDRTRVFERFYRATSARGKPGSGLGLAIVADAVAMHGGTVRAQETPGGGALLRLTLPLAPGTPSWPGVSSWPDAGQNDPPAPDSPWRRPPAPADSSDPRPPRPGTSPGSPPVSAGPSAGPSAGGGGDPVPTTRGRKADRSGGSRTRPGERAVSGP